MDEKFFFTRRGFLTTAGAAGGLVALESIKMENPLLNVANAAVRNQSIVWAGISNISTKQSNDLPFLTKILDDKNKKREINFRLEDALLKIPQESFEERKLNLGFQSTNADRLADFALVLAAVSEITVLDATWFDESRGKTIDMKTVRLICYAFLFNIETLSMVGSYPVKVFANNAAIDSRNKISLEELYFKLLTSGGEDLSGENATISSYFTEKLINYPFTEKITGPRCKIEKVVGSDYFNESCKSIGKDPISIKNFLGHTATMYFGDVFKANTYPFIAEGDAYRRDIAMKIADEDRVLNLTPENDPNFTIEPSILGWDITKFDVPGDNDKISITIEAPIIVSMFDRFAGKSELIYEQFLIASVEYGSFKSESLSRDPFSYLALMYERMLEACFVSIKDKNYRKQLIEGISTDDGNLLTYMQLYTETKDEIKAAEQQSERVASLFKI